MKKEYAMSFLEAIFSEVNTASALTRTEEDTNKILQKIGNEKINIHQGLLSQLFKSKNEKQTRLVIQQYSRALITLIDRAYQLFNHTPKNETSNLEILEYLSIVLEELERFIEITYPQYRSEEERVPLPELVCLKVELEEQLLLLPAALVAGNNTEKLSKIVTDTFHGFIDRIDRQEMITVKEAQYHREMISDLLEPTHDPQVLPDCPTLHEQVFYWNLNSKETIAHFTTGLDAIIAGIEGPAAQLEYLHYQFKLLLQLPTKPKTIYDRRYPSMKSFMSDWLRNELSYLQLKVDGFTPLGESLTNENVPRPSPLKVLVGLSVDQMALIFRSANELKLLMAKSIDSVLQMVAPHLSTKHKEDLSWRSMRSKAFSGEERDKRIAIDALRGMIKKIEEY